MQHEGFLHYGELVYAAAIVCVLVYIWFRLRRKSHQLRAPSHEDAIPNDDQEPRIDNLSLTRAVNENSAQWWSHEDFPYSAPWWLRYPASITVFSGSYWAFFEWDKKASWIFGVLLAIIALGLVRELFVAAIVAALTGLALWAFGAAVAALPVSVAIIIGAMIIAQSVRR